MIEEFLRSVLIGEHALHLRREDLKKARELEAFLAEVAHIFAKTKRRLTVVDAAAGRAYLGLLLAHALPQSLEVIALERDPRIVELSRDAVARVTFANTDTTFEARAGDVADLALWPREADLVVGLHTCGPAFDNTAASAIASGAKRLALVPCCTGAAVGAHAGALDTAERLGIAGQAEVRNRFIQSYIDSVRTLTLEAAGYETEVVAFVPPTVTPHNLLWRSRRVREPRRMQRAAEQLARLQG